MRRTAAPLLQAAMKGTKLLLIMLFGCTTDDDAPCGNALRVAGDDAPIGHYEAGVLALDEHFLAGLPSEAVTVAELPLFGTQLLVPTDDGTWHIHLVADDGAVDVCDWRYRTEVWTTDTWLARFRTWHLLKHSTECRITKQIASWLTHS